MFGAPVWEPPPSTESGQGSRKPRPSPDSSRRWPWWGKATQCPIPQPYPPALSSSGWARGPDHPCRGFRISIRLAMKRQRHLAFRTDPAGLGFGGKGFFAERATGGICRFGIRLRCRSGSSRTGSLDFIVVGSPAFRIAQCFVSLIQKRGIGGGSSEIRVILQLAHQRAVTCPDDFHRSIGLNF